MAAGTPPKNSKGPQVTAQPVGQLLRPGGLGIGVGTGPEHGDEDLRLTHLARGAIDHAERLTGVIDEALLARHMMLTQDEVLRGEPAAVLIAEDTVLPAIGLRRLVLLPQLKPCGAGTFELTLELGEIRGDLARERYLALIELRLQCRFVQRLGQRTADTGLLGPAQTRLHRRARAANGARSGCRLNRFRT